MAAGKLTLVAAVATSAFVVAAAAAIVPVTKWSHWYYGDRFSFCDHELEGSAVVFVVDRSGSNNAGLSAAKSRIVELVERVAPHFELGVVFSDAGTACFPEPRAVLRATRRNKRRLTEFVAKVAPGGASCIRRGLLDALDMVESSRSRKRTVVYLGDGGGTCLGASEPEYLGETLREVAARNTGGVIIHCVITEPGNQLSSDFVHALAGESGGTVVPECPARPDPDAAFR